MSDLFKIFKDRMVSPIETADVKQAPPQNPTVLAVDSNISWQARVVEAIEKESSYYLGWKETNGKNRSPQIDAMIKRQGGALGSPYCIYGIQDVDDRVCAALGAKSLLPKTGGSQELFRLTPQQYHSDKPQFGFIGIFQDIWDHSHGHGVICLSGLLEDNTHFLTREFNTNQSGSRDGSDVMDSKRSIHGNVYLKLRGFLNWPAMIIDVKAERLP